MVSLNKISRGLIDDTKSYAKSQMNDEAKEYSKLNLNEIIQVDFPNDQYVREQTEKRQIVLHHTVSGMGVEGDIAWWRQSAERIGTSIIIGFDGKIYQCFSTKYWAYHLGAGNSSLDKHSIGIEIDSWGGLVRYQNKWYPGKWSDKLKRYVANISVKPIQNVMHYSQEFRGFYAFEKYTDAQIEAVRKLLIFWNERYGIPLKYNENMWETNSMALDGIPGVWTHVSFRTDKSDCHPQPELIQMLKSLE